MIQPEYLYKYLTVDRLKEIVTQNKIFFPTLPTSTIPLIANSERKNRFGVSGNAMLATCFERNRCKIPRWGRRKITKQSGYVFAESYERF